LIYKSNFQNLLRAKVQKVQVIMTCLSNHYDESAGCRSEAA
jgi:hypothetical protein